MGNLMVVRKMQMNTAVPTLLDQWQLILGLIDKLMRERIDFTQHRFISLNDRIN